MNSKEALYRITRAVWYVFYIIEVLLVLRFTLKLLGANPGAAFTELVYAASAIFVAPFQYVFGTPVAGEAVIELSTLLAMVIYWIVAWGIVKLIVMHRSVDSHEAERALESEDNA